MYEQFTDRGRKVIQLANEEAQRVGHEYIGTEHILLGLVKEGSGVAANVLRNLGIKLTGVRTEVERILQRGVSKSCGNRPNTPRAKQVVEYAIEEARQFDHKYIGTEHLLLGLLREREGVAAQVLTHFGLNLNEVRIAVLNILGKGRDWAIGEGLDKETEDGPLAPEVSEATIDYDFAGAVARRATSLTLSVEARLLEEICRIPILDPHSHINPLAPAANSFDEILGYHYYTELAHSAGMDKTLLAASVPPADRVAALAKFLPQLSNTVQYSWLLEIARTFFRFNDDAIDETNVGQLAATAEKSMSMSDWSETVLKQSGVEKIFLTNDFDDPLDGFDTIRYVPCLRTDDLVFRLDNKETLERLRRAANVHVHDTVSLRDAIGKVFQHFVQRGAKACAISLPPDFEPIAVGTADMESSLNAILAGRGVAPDDVRAIERFVFWTLASFCAEFRLPFDLMIGVNRRVYRDGVFQGQDLFDQRTSLYQYRELFNAFPRVTFPVSVLTSNQNQELVSYAWIFPNVIPHGHWWYSNIPAYIEPDARARLTAVPATKQIGYYSDAYKLEFILPKFNMYRRVLAKILARDFVIELRWSEERAVAFARQILQENPQRIFGV